MPVEVIRNPKTPTSHLPFSPAIRAGDFVFVSGQASVDTDGKIVTDSFKGEFQRSIDNVRLILEAAGLSLAHVVQVKSYLGREDDLAEYNELYRATFNEPFPARSTIVGVLGTKLKFEIDVVAYDGK
jgi:2-iminobutanoate/2-iminopropanoate deaminase